MSRVQFLYVKLGVKIEKLIKNLIKFMARFRIAFAKRNTELNFSNSGTASRLIIGALSTTPNIEVKLTRRSFFEQKKYEKIN